MIEKLTITNQLESTINNLDNSYSLIPDFTRKNFIILIDKMNEMIDKINSIQNILDIEFNLDMKER